jgi:hypothetical protein
LGNLKTQAKILTAFALFTIVKLWKQPRYPTTDECIKKKSHTHTHTQDYYLLLKKLYHLQVNGWNWRLSVQKDKGCMFSVICKRQTQKINVYINTYIIIYTYIENMFIIVELFQGSRGKRERKRE